MEGLIRDFVSLFGPWGAAFATVFAVTWYLFGDLYKQSGRDWWISLITAPRFLTLYSALLERALDGVDDWFRSGVAHDPLVSERSTGPWSHAVFVFSVRLAFLYPFLTVVGAAAFTDQPALLGALVLLPAPVEQGVAVIGLGMFVFALVGFRIASASPLVWAGRIMWVLAFLIGVGGLFALGEGFGITALEDPEAAIPTMVVIGMGVMAILPVRQIYRWVWFMLVGGSLIALGLLLGWLGFGPQRALGEGEGTALLVLICAIAGASSFAMDWIFRRTGVFSEVLFLSIFLALIAAFAFFASEGEFHAETMVLAFFLGVLPVLNALADFTSIGLTRKLLRDGLAADPVRAAFLDIAGAVAVLLALGSATILFFALFRGVEGADIVMPSQVLGEIDRDGTGYLWLGLCLFSTLIPTLLHAGLALFGYTLTLFRRVGLNLASGLRSDIETVGRLSSLAFSLTAALAIWAPFFLVWHLGRILGPLLLEILLGFWILLARMLGL